MVMKKFFPQIQLKLGTRYVPKPTRITRSVPVDGP